MKPKEGTEHVYIRPIPQSDYSIRLFPGSYYGQEWGMDFVNTRTGEPVNSPFPHELWCIPSLSTPWLQTGVHTRLYTIEKSFGITDDKLLPGEEKYILRDGLTCLLKRPGHRDVMFTVPIRRDQQPPEAPIDADVLDFPEVLVR